MFHTTHKEGRNTTFQEMIVEFCKVRHLSRTTVCPDLTSIENKTRSMRFITVALVVLLLVALTYATSEKKRLPCARTCMVNALESDSKSAKKEFPKCLRTCLAKSSITKDDTAALLKKVEKLKNLLVKENVQEAVAELKEEAEVESDSTLAAGATLQATTGLKVRSGPCTDKKVLTTLASGATVKFTGAVQNQCDILGMEFLVHLDQDLLHPTSSRLQALEALVAPLAVPELTQRTSNVIADGEVLLLEAAVFARLVA